MLRLNRFEYLAPKTVEDALEKLQKHADDAALMAGGTDVLVNIKHRLCTPSYVIGIRELPELNTFSMDDDGYLNIGAAVTLRLVENAPVVQARYPALAHAAHLVSTPQVRAVGTIGGNACLDVRCNYYNQSEDWRRAVGYCMKKDSEICLVAPGGDRCWAVASADTVPVFIALRSEVTVVGPDGQRRMRLEQLYQDDGLIPLTLKPGEILAALHVPPPDGYRCVYQKFRIRQSFDFPLVGVATSVKLGEDGSVEDARVVMTAVASFPERATPAENLLAGNHLDEDAIASAGQAVFRQAKPMDNTAGTIFHRKRMARILFERGLRSIAGGSVDGEAIVA
jgi:4-hydroxybenzoyl-CoA reductase subunit beta